MASSTTIVVQHQNHYQQPLTQQWQQQAQQRVGEPVAYTRYYDSIRRDPSGHAGAMQMAERIYCSCPFWTGCALLGLGITLVAVGITNLSDKVVGSGLGCLGGGLVSAVLAGCVWKKCM